MEKKEDVMAILKLYELRRDPEMRAARQWYFSKFAPRSARDIVALYRGGERASANFRMVVSYWDSAAALVMNDGIDRRMFLDANTEHIFVYAKIADFLPEVREMFREPDLFMHLETLCRSMPDFETKIANRRRLIAIWESSDAESPQFTKKYSVEEKRKDDANAYAKWTDEEDAKLKALFEEGETVDRLSMIFQRNRGSINSRLAKLGLRGGK